jgi:hypothetical protein
MFLASLTFSQLFITLAMVVLRLVRYRILAQIATGYLVLWHLSVGVLGKVDRSTAPVVMIVGCGLHDHLVGGLGEPLR